MRTKAEAVAALRADQQFWRDLAARVGPSRYAEPGPMGEWSFSDMAGHLVGWRNRTINRQLPVTHNVPSTRRASCIYGAYPRISAVSSLALP